MFNLNCKNQHNKIINC